MTLVDILLKERKDEEKYFKNYIYYGKLIKRLCEQSIGKVKVLIFGSVIKEKLPRDIDILIISKKLTSEEKSKVRAWIFRKIGFSAPFEIHLVNEEEYEGWYKHFIDKKIEIKE